MASRNHAERASKVIPEVCFIFFYSTIFSCGPWRNSIQLWQKKGYTVSVFQLYDANNHTIDAEHSRAFQLYEITYSRFSERINRLLKILERLCLNLKLVGIANFMGEMRYLVKSFAFIWNCNQELKNKHPAVVIGGDPQGLITAYLASRRNRTTKLVYWCLELWIEHELRGKVGQWLLKKLEKWISRKAECVIDFGPQRCEILRKENNLDPSKLFSIANAPLGPAIRQRQFYFNDKFGIDHSRKLVLYAGGTGGNSGIEDVLRSMESWPDFVDLVIHSKTPSEQRRKELTSYVRKPQKVYLSFEPVPYAALGKIYASCDVGLALEKPININTNYLDMSSGKMFHYLQFGVPVITRNLPGYDEMIVQRNLGACINDVNEIRDVLLRLLSSLDKYNESCLQFYEENRFEYAHDRILSLLEG